MEIVPQLVLNSIIAGAIYTMIALGFNLIYSTAKFFDVGYGALAAVGGYMVFYFYKKLGLGLPLSVIIALIIAGSVGYLIYQGVYRRLRARKASNLVLLIASLGVFTALQALLAMLFSSQFQTLSRGAREIKVFEIFGAVITDVQLTIFIVGLAIMGGLSLVIKKTLFGKALTAVSDDEEVAKVIGINTDKILERVFIVGSMIAALTGILVGIGNVYGSVLGAFVLGFVENFGIWKISGEWKDAIAFALLIIFLIFRPHGILRR